MRDAIRRLICSQCALVRMGRELGIPTPYNEYTYHMIKALEEKNDGKFDYSKEDGEITCSR
ncbi:MAG: ketopantoate reductase C-terminal domain-containing protein [Ruminococcus sp.]